MLQHFKFKGVLLQKLSYENNILHNIHLDTPFSVWEDCKSDFFEVIRMHGLSL